MTTTNKQDATSAFLFAREWHQANLNEQIPEEIWAKQIQGLSDETDWQICAGDTKFIAEGLGFIPILAAVSAGKQGLSLLHVCRHHNIQPYYLKSIEIQVHEGKIIGAALDSGFEVPLSAWNVCNEIVQAISGSELNIIGFDRSIPHLTSRPDLALAFLHSKQSNLWPVTPVRRVRDNPKEQRTACGTCPVTVFSKCGVDLRDYSDARILELLERSGNLLEGMAAEDGLRQTFFFNLFTEIDSGGERNLERLVQAINSIDDRDQIRKVADIITAQLSSHSLPWGLTKGIAMYRALDTYLDPVKYEKVFNSVLIRVCATSLKDVIDIMGISPGEVDYTRYEDILLNSKHLMSKLVQELSPLTPSDYRGSHFYALSRLASDDYDSPSLKGLDLNALVLKTLEALDAYNGATHLDVLGNEASEMKNEANRNTSRFVEFLSSRMEIDYAQFSEVSSESRILLASSGFEIKHIPNLSRHERGRLLSDQLGL